MDVCTLLLLFLSSSALEAPAASQGHVGCTAEGSDRHWVARRNGFRCNIGYQARQRNRRTQVVGMEKRARGDVLVLRKKTKFFFQESSRLLAA